MMMRFFSFFGVLVAACTGLEAAPTAGKSAWVWVDARGRLEYRSTQRGDRIMDFSSAGYAGGGVPLPTVPAVATVEPSGGDDTAGIQAALDRAGGLPEAAGGFRGAVQLGAGEYRISRTLRLHASGIVLRGAGSGPGGTVLRMEGGAFTAFEIGSRAEPEIAGESFRVLDAYVPSGTSVLTVEDASGLKPGEPVLVRRPVTRQWVRAMGMAGLTRNGRAEHWAGGVIRWERTVRAVSGNRVELDIPLSDALDARELAPEGAQVVPYRFPGRIHRVGLEDLRVAAPAQHVDLGARLYSGIRIGAAEDVWVRGVVFTDTMNTVATDSWARRITIDQVAIQHATAIEGHALPLDFGMNGSQILVAECAITGDRTFYAGTGAEAVGPNVVFHCVFRGNGAIQPHQRWATGLLVDNCDVPGGSIDLMNRGEMGSGHGWTMGWGVIWNSQAKSFLVQQPPGACNWSIGCEGEERTAPMPVFGGPKGPDLPQGIIDSAGRPVEPRSLYVAQLAERLQSARVSGR